MMERLVPISEREFNIYALSLLRGPNFEPFEFVEAWKAKQGAAVGAVFAFPKVGDFLVLAMCRQGDHRFVITFEDVGFHTLEAANQTLHNHLIDTKLPAPVAPGYKRRSLLLETGRRKPCPNFQLLTGTPNHLHALMTVGEAYLAMPNPDENFVSDFQTEGFDARLWELYLLAVFREQGLVVQQDLPSPDFHIERGEHECYVEAVTANPSEGRGLLPTRPQFAPEDHRERLYGGSAERFAKTLRSKLQRGYDQLPHVIGKPFALALADFHAASSMVWSREALPTYLYGYSAHVESRDGADVAVGTPITNLIGKDRIPAGLFRDPAMAHLSAVIFSNAATIAKFNRMGFLAGWKPFGVSMIRSGTIFDRKPGALKPISFEFDILSEGYTALWPGGEMWCQELEVYHNPLAANPINIDLLPGATHWFGLDNEIECKTMWENCVLASTTLVKSTKDRNSR